MQKKIIYNRGTTLATQNHHFKVEMVALTIVYQVIVATENRLRVYLVRSGSRARKYMPRHSNIVI